jgi:hypothetical protein
MFYIVDDMILINYLKIYVLTIHGHLYTSIRGVLLKFSANLLCFLKTIDIRKLNYKFSSHFVMWPMLKKKVKGYGKRSLYTCMLFHKRVFLINCIKISGPQPFADRHAKSM